MLYRARLQPRFRSSAEPEVEEKQMEHANRVSPSRERGQHHTRLSETQQPLQMQPALPQSYFFFSPPYNFIDNARCTWSMSVILRCLQMLPNVQISYSETLQDILLCFMQHINRSCHFKWKYVAQAHCYSMGVEHLGINIVLIICSCEVCHTTNLPLPKLYLKLCLNREITPHFQGLSLLFFRNYSVSKGQIQLSGRFLPLQQNIFFFSFFVFFFK